MPRSRLLPAALALALAGCTRHPAAPLAISKLTIAEESVAAAPALGLGAEKMREAVESALKAQGVVLLKPEQPPPSGTQVYKVRAEIEKGDPALAALGTDNVRPLTGT